jgi:hypothetical protein
MGNVILNTLSGRVADVPMSREVIKEVLEWAGVAKNRAIWSADPFAYTEFARQIRERFEKLEQLDITESTLLALAEAALVEVSVRAEASELGFAAVVAPWEYLLASATSEIRNGSPFTVVRHMLAPQANRSNRPGKLLVVISGPDAIGDYYSFESEARLIRASFRESGKLLRNPTLDDLRQEVTNDPPDVIHVTGVDLHQGALLLNRPDTWGAAEEGMYLADGFGNPTAVSALEIAAALTAADQKPMIVGFNFYNAASIAAHTVLNGAGSAVAFHGTFDDRLAETFFSRFYEALQTEAKAQYAFDQVWRTIRSESRDVFGAGVVLWSTESIAPIVMKVEPPLRLTKRKRALKPTEPVPQPELVSALPVAAPTMKQAVDLELSARPCDINITPRTAINYSLLHNGRGLFTKFEYRKHVPETLELDVAVELQVQRGEKSSFVRKFTLDKPSEDLSKEIYIPLTWISDLRLKESVFTNVDVTLTLQHGEDEPDVTKRPYQVKLLPPDQWTDDEVNRQWLPSFVLPRDPAVSQVISAAEKLLPALADHRDASFDGYQSIGRDSEDPYGAVDTQVQSIWAALSLHMQLRYVNPPPGYEKVSQRLRTPSQVMAGSRGTCIDLALLIASCLEFVDIYPVLFLLKGHAFVGYWRSDALYKKFRNLTPNTETPDKSIWMYPVTAYQHVMDQIRGGALVPLEATLLTQRGGFGDAIEEGYMNMRNSDEFEALLDVSLARYENVLPLPLSEFG